MSSFSNLGGSPLYSHENVRLSGGAVDLHRNPVVTVRDIRNHHVELVEAGRDDAGKLSVGHYPADFHGDLTCQGSRADQLASRGWWCGGSEAGAEEEDRVTWTGGQCR